MLCLYFQSALVETIIQGATCSSGHTTYTSTPMEQLSGAIWGSLSCTCTCWRVLYRGQGSKPSTFWLLDDSSISSTTAATVTFIILNNSLGKSAAIYLLFGANSCEFKAWKGQGKLHYRKYGVMHERSSINRHPHTFANNGSNHLHSSLLDTQWYTRWYKDK